MNGETKPDQPTINYDDMSVEQLEQLRQTQKGMGGLVTAEASAGLKAALERKRLARNIMQQRLQILRRRGDGGEMGGNDQPPQTGGQQSLG